MHECFDIWEKNWSTKVHNVMLKTYADIYGSLGRFGKRGKMFQNNTLDSPKRWLDAGYRSFHTKRRTSRRMETENKKIFYGNAVGLTCKVLPTLMSITLLHNFIKNI